jgi:hypothetical protein
MLPTIFREVFKQTPCAHWTLGGPALTGSFSTLTVGLMTLHLPEARKTTPQVLMVLTPEPLLPISRFSSYWKLLHVTVSVLRFVKSLKEKRKHDHSMTASEMEEARTSWIRQVQEEYFAAELSALRQVVPLPRNSKIARFNPFLQEGLIRLGGRLQFADLSDNECHPLLLDGSHPFTCLLLHQTHIRLHYLGVRIVLVESRNEFWILKARQVTKKVLRTCPPCKIAHNRRGEQLEALPSDRFRPTRPFAVT